MLGYLFRRTTHTSPRAVRMSRPVREELLSMCRAQALDQRDIGNHAIVDCGCLDLDRGRF